MSDEERKLLEEELYSMCDDIQSQTEIDIDYFNKMLDKYQITKDSKIIEKLKERNLILRNLTLVVETFTEENTDEKDS